MRPVSTVPACSICSRRPWPRTSSRRCSRSCGATGKTLPTCETSKTTSMWWPRMKPIAGSSRRPPKRRSMRNMGSERRSLLRASRRTMFPSSTNTCWQRSLSCPRERSRSSSWRSCTGCRIKRLPSDWISHRRRSTITSPRHCVICVRTENCLSRLLFYCCSSRHNVAAGNVTREGSAATGACNKALSEFPLRGCSAISMLSCLFGVDPRGVCYFFL